MSEIAGRYVIVRQLGKGSFAETYLARDAGQDRLVALKVLLPRSHDWKSYDLFEREARVLRELRHQGIPTIHESFRAEWNGADAAFLAMEYISGQSLAEIIAEGRRLDESEVLRLFLEVLSVLEYLHTRVPPVLHRDVKPANLIVRDDGSVALVDFGAVRTVFRGPEEEGSTVVGTYGYMPYEQFMGQATPASDLYALAATFVHLISGRAPPEFMTESGRLEVPADLPVGASLRSVLTRMLAPVPGDRFKSARDVRQSLLSEMSALPATTPIGIPALPPPEGVLPAVPRRIEGETAALFRRVVYSPSMLMDPEAKPGAGWNVADAVLVIVFSVLTVGLMPTVFWSVYLSRKRRTKEFIIHGLPATARVLAKTREAIGFDSHLTRVRYEFQVDGQEFRDSDTVLPSIAERWDTGTLVQILYLPDREYDSVIVSTS